MLILFYFAARWNRERASQRVRHYGLEFLAGSRPREALQHCIIAKSFRWCCTSILIISHLPTSYIRPRSKCSFRFARDLHSRVTLWHSLRVSRCLLCLLPELVSRLLRSSNDPRVRSSNFLIRTIAMPNWSLVILPDRLCVPYIKIKFFWIVSPVNRGKSRTDFKIRAERKRT